LHAAYKWIDFDLDQRSADFDIWSVGNILHCVAAKKFVTFQEAIKLRPQLSGPFPMTMPRFSFRTAL
jgi:hypothetical protein